MNDLLNWQAFGALLYQSLTLVNYWPRNLAPWVLKFLFVHPDQQEFSLSDLDSLAEPDSEILPLSLAITEALRPSSGELDVRCEHIGPLLAQRPDLLTHWNSAAEAGDLVSALCATALVQLVGVPISNIVRGLGIFGLQAVSTSHYAVLTN